MHKGKSSGWIRMKPEYSLSLSRFNSWGASLAFMCSFYIRKLSTQSTIQYRDTPWMKAVMFLSHDCVGKSSNSEQIQLIKLLLSSCTTYFSLSSSKSIQAFLRLLLEAKVILSGVSFWLYTMFLKCSRPNALHFVLNLGKNATL